MDEISRHAMVESKKQVALAKSAHLASERAQHYNDFSLPDEAFLSIPLP